MFTNFSPIRHVNDVKGTYFVKKINIYLIKNSFVFTSRGPWIFGFISSAAHFSIYGSEFDDLFLQGTVVVNGQEVEIKKAAFNMQSVDKEKVNTYFFL